MSSPFRIASYNILADAYIKPDRYPLTDPELLLPQRRRAALAEKIASLDADIICLQEVEQDVFAYLENHLASQAYNGIYAQKGNAKRDGCATFFRPAMLPLVESNSLYYADGILPSGHLALITSFALEVGTIQIANTHLKWDHYSKPKHSHIGYQQAEELLTVLTTTAETPYASFICGDLNVTPDSAVAGLIGAHGFADAYRGHEQPTCNAHQQTKRLDYIFHSTNLRAMPEEIPGIEDNTPLPSETEPSDHLAIVARFE